MGVDRIDIVTIDLLYIEQQAGRIIMADFFSSAFNCFGPILAEHVAQVAV